IFAAAMFALSACGKAPEQPKAADDNPTPAEQAADRDALVAKAWGYLKTMYNKPAPEGDRQGIMAGWGPQSMNVPYTGMVLHGLVGTQHWNADEPMIRDSMNWLMESQETTGAWSLMPGVERLVGIRAVYVTSICAQLFADANSAQGP